MPAGVSPGCWRPCRGGLTPPRVSRTRAAVAPDDVRELGDVDGLGEEPVETSLAQPRLAPVQPERAQRDDRDLRRSCVAPQLARDREAVEVRKLQVEQDEVRPFRDCVRERLGSCPRLHRPQPGEAEHIDGEPPVTCVVVDHEDERTVFLTHQPGIWRRGRHRRILTPMPITLVLAEDQYLVREGLRRLLEAQADLEVAAVCDDLDSLLAAVEVERPDVVVTDIRMPPESTDEGIRAAARLRDTHPDVGVVVLSQYATPGYVLALLEGGSEGRAYLLKERVKDVDQLLAAIRAVAEGGSVMDPKVVEALVAENARAEDSPLNELTPRERDVLREMAEGKNNAAIAESLFLTQRSVEKVIHSIFLKLGLTWETAVHKRVKAVILYLAESG